MILDITNEIYDLIKTKLTDVTVLQEYPEDVPIFPCVIVYDGGYIDTDDSFDSAGEYFNSGEIKFEIFSNLANKRENVKDIRNRIDTELKNKYRLRRNFDDIVPNFIDTGVLRRLITYSFKINKNGLITKQ